MNIGSGHWTIALDGTSLPDKALIGGKAWSIAWMQSLGLPVPPAFVITTEACRQYLQSGTLPPALLDEIALGISWLEKETGKALGDPHDPLLLSVRSGAPVSMPGMMDTVLNLGIDPTTERALARLTGDEDFARDTHRRFYELYSSIVLRLSHPPFSGADNSSWDSDIIALGGRMPKRSDERLIEAVRAVFESWHSRRAKRYREHHGISHHLGTAVTIQAMVFGNRDARSGTGVLFTRNPLNGAKVPFGEYLPRAQGEDVVSGKFTPLPLSVMRDTVPDAYKTLLDAAARLEQVNCDIQDIEFTVESGTLYLLQTRSAKRAPEAAVQVAVDMVDEGLITPQVALSRVTSEQIKTLLLPRLADEISSQATIIASGEGACPGIAVGIVVTDPDEAEKRARAGDAVILARRTTSPDDVHGMIAAKGVVTEHGGATSHAAVVCRALGRPCVVGTGEGIVMLAGRTITLDGESGNIFDGALRSLSYSESEDERLTRLIEWARHLSSVKVCSPEDAPNGPEVIDLDVLNPTIDLDGMAAAIRGAKAVRGSIFHDNRAIAVAIDQGVELIIIRPVLPALLAILEHSS